MGAKKKLSASERQDDAAQATLVATKRARKELRRAVRRATRDVADFRETMQELRSMAADSARDVVISVESRAAVVRSDLEGTLGEAARLHRSVEAATTELELRARGCDARLVALTSRENELEREHGQAMSRIEAVEATIARQAAQTKQAFDDHLERLRVTTATGIEQMRAAELERVEQAVNEIEVQARAVLNRSADRIGSLLASAETRAMGSMPSPAPSPEPLAEPGQWTPPDAAEDPVHLGGSVADPAADEGCELEAEREFFERLSSEFRVAPWQPQGVEEFSAPFPPPIDADAETLEWSGPREPHRESDPVVARRPDRIPEAVPDSPEALFTPSPFRNGRLVAVPTDAAHFETAEADRRSASVIAPLDVLAEAARSLARRDVDYVRVELSRRVHGEESRPLLRLCAQDREGWWHVRDVPARTRAAALEPVVVLLADLVEILSALADADSRVEAELAINPQVAIEGHVLDRHDPHLVPAPPYGGEQVERIDLSAADGGGVGVDTRHRRVVIPPHLAGYLRTAGLTDVEVTEFDETSVLTARAPQQFDRLGVLCIAILPAPSDGDGLADRRKGGRDEAAQLIAVLSADSTPQELERILKVGVGYVRRRAAANPKLPAEVLAEIIESGSDAMRAAAAANPSIRADASRKAAADDAIEVRAALAENATVSSELLEQLAVDPAAHVRTRVALNPSAGAEVLHRLATDEEPAVRMAVARRADTGADSLRALAVDADHFVCAAVAANSSCPQGVLEDLVSMAPEQVLGNPSAPEALLAAGSQLAVTSLRAAVAGNPSTPAPVLRRLARDSEADVLRGVAQHPRTPPKFRRRVIRRLASLDEG